MATRLHFGGLLLVAIFGCLSNVNLRAQESTMSAVLASTPDRANAILYFDAKSVREFTKGTPLHDDLPESLGEIQIAGNLDLKTLETTWEIGYASFPSLPEANWIAKGVGGYVDTISGFKAIWSPRNSYLVPVGGNTLGVVRPSDRRLAGRWLSKETGANVSPYLKNLAEQGNKFVSVLLAVDLENAWSPIAIQQRIETLESLKKADIKSVANMLATIKGVRVLANRQNLDDCIISLDFGTSPASLLPVASAFFEEVLSRNNSSIPEASKWKPSVESNSLRFRGAITPATLDDLLGFFSLQRQASNVSSSDLKEPVNTTSESITLETTKSYYAKTSGLIKRVRDYSASNTGDRAQWNARMARRIDELPTLNVDPEMIDYGSKISQALRGNAVTLQQANISNATNAVVSATSGGFGNSFYGVGNGYFNDGNSPYQFKAMARGEGYSSYREMISDIDQMEADFRKRMTAKYKVQF